MAGVESHSPKGQAGQPTPGGLCSRGVPPSPGMLGAGDFSEGQEKDPTLKGGGLGQSPDSEVPHCVTVSKACPSLNFSFLPGKMRHQALSHSVPLCVCHFCWWGAGEAPLTGRRA